MLRGGAPTGWVLIATCNFRQLCFSIAFPNLTRTPCSLPQAMLCPPRFSYASLTFSPTPTGSQVPSLPSAPFHVPSTFENYSLYPILKSNLKLSSCNVAHLDHSGEGGHTQVRRKAHVESVIACVSQHDTSGFPLLHPSCSVNRETRERGRPNPCCGLHSRKAICSSLQTHCRF